MIPGMSEGRCVTAMKDDEEGRRRVREPPSSFVATRSCVVVFARDPTPSLTRTGRALEVVRRFPTLQSLLSVYEDPALSRAEKEAYFTVRVCLRASSFSTRVLLIGLGAFESRRPFPSLFLSPSLSLSRSLVALVCGSVVAQHSLGPRASGVLSKRLFDFWTALDGDTLIV